MRRSERDDQGKPNATCNTVTGGQVMGKFSVFQGTRGHIRK